MLRYFIFLLVLALPVTANAQRPKTQLSFCVIKGTMSIDLFFRRALECPSALLELDVLIKPVWDKNHTVNETISGTMVDIGATHGDEDKGVGYSEDPKDPFFYEASLQGVTKRGGDYRAKGTYSASVGGLYQGYMTGIVSPEKITSRREACGVQLAVLTFASFRFTPSEPMDFEVAEECKPVLGLQTMCRIWTNVARARKQGDESLLASIRPAHCRRM